MIKKIRLTLFLSIMSLAALLLASCGGDKGLVVWVGAESQSFYQEVVDKYVADNELGIKITVEGADSGSAAAAFMNDTNAGADVFTIPHDQFGTLVAGSGAIEAIKSPKLQAQIKAQNESKMQEVVRHSVKGSTKAFYGVPYIKQALVYFYDKRLITEDQVGSWESILAVAKEKNKLATAFSGGDGYNFSLFTLAVPYDDTAKAAFPNGSTLKLYEGANLANCDNTGDDQVAILKWASRFIKDPNGLNGSIVTSDGGLVDAKNGKVLGYVGGAWDYNAVCSAFGGEANVGVATLPTFTLTKDDEYGVAKEGMVFKSGSFVDVKCFVKKKDSKYADYLDDLMAYLASDDVQKESYAKANNLPSSKTVTVDYSANALAKAQDGMTPYGIPQPFGYRREFNVAYYQTGAPDYYSIILRTKDAVTDAQRLVQLQTIAYIWTHIEVPATVKDLNDWMEGKDEDYNCMLTDKTPAAALNVFKADDK